MNRLSLTCLGGVLCSGLLQPLPAGAQAGNDPYGGQLGTVQWPTSCASAVQPQLERGLALLHHMTYRGARATFEAVAVQDPDCAMAYWGQSMTHIHPLWSDPPSEESFQQGLSMAEKAAQQPGLTDRERAMVAAVQRYWAVGRSSDERPNLEAFAEGWNQALQKYPGDSEIRSFAALAMLSTADPGDKSYRIQRQASAIAAPVLKQVPDHPGANHYTIHAHDLPTLADQALGVARDYGRIAPSVPHALHMPSHIFTRLGLWEESVEMNSRSARAALQHPAGEAISLHYLHALDYLAYAYLQQGNPDAAAEVAAVMEGLEEPLQTHLASGYTLAAVPARIALEQQRWESAADVAVGSPERFPWQKFPAMEAISRFSRSLGAARSGQTSRAEAELRRLEQLEVAASETSAYWGKQVAIMRQSALAWLLFSQGDQEEALVAMQAAAALEATTEKHAVTPGEVLPAQELLGDMLMELARPAEAYQAYVAVLERSPGRLNSLYGAGRAAEEQGNKALARTHYGDLVTTVGRTARSPRIDHARAALRGQ